MATTVTQNLPPQFVTDIGTDLSKQLLAQSAVPVVAPGIDPTTGKRTGITQLAGEDAEQFAARQKAAQQFSIREQSLSGLAPTIAKQDDLQTRAQTLATEGLGSFQPFLDTAQEQFSAAGKTVGNLGLGALTADQLATKDAQGNVVRPDLVEGSYMSPYQSQVIDASLKAFDEQAKKREIQLADQAIAAGAFGGTREGVQRAEQQRMSDDARAALVVQLNQQGFGQAQAARQQDIANQFNLAQAQAGLGQQQQGLASLVPGLQRADVAQLGSLGAINQAQTQAEADAQREAARQAAMLPQEQLQQYGAQVTGLMGGYPGSTQSTFTPNPTPLQSALGIGTTLAGLYLGKK